MERLVQETNLAWALADAAKPHPCAVERNDVYVPIGAGETFGAIGQLFKWVAMKRIPLRPDLVQRCTMWLDAYVGHNEERYLRRLIEDFVIPHPIQVPATVGINQLPTKPKTGQLVALTNHRDTPIRRFASSTERMRASEASQASSAGHK